MYHGLTSFYWSLASTAQYKLSECLSTTTKALHGHLYNPAFTLISQAICRSPEADSLFSIL